ncbi:MAG: HAD hydrolase family protein [Acidobacteriota bacterium]
MGTAKANRGISSALEEKIRAIRLLVFDVDGVLTDGGIWFAEAGRELKRFDVKDGAGLAFAKACGLDLAWITGRTSQVVERRAKEIGVKWLYQGRLHKVPALKEILEESGLGPEQISYMGDDFVDLAVMSLVGATACPADAHDSVRQVADFVCEKPGGRGAVREWIDLVLTVQGKMTDLEARYREVI